MYRVKVKDIWKSFECANAHGEMVKLFTDKWTYFEDGDVGSVMKNNVGLIVEEVAKENENESASGAQPVKGKGKKAESEIERTGITGEEKC